MSATFQISSNGPRYEEKEGRWCATAENGNTCDLELSPAAFLPLIESSISELIAAHPAAERFPFSTLLDRAASSESQYWQERALDRIEELNLSHDCADVLRNLLTKGLTQGIRHQAARLLRCSDG